MKNGNVQIAVLVSGGGTNLQALLDAKKRGEISHADIALVLSSRHDAYALKRAEKAGIQTYTVVRSDRYFEEKIRYLLEEYDIDLIVLAGFLAILSEDFVKRYPDRIINVHPSLIPAFCGSGYYGLRVHEAALSYGVKITGATVHFVNEIPDGGKILLQKALDVHPDDTAETLQKRVMEEAEWVLLPKACQMVVDQIMEEKGYVNE